MNALRLSILTLSLSLISGCSSLWPFGKEEVRAVQIQTKAVERTRLNLRDPEPLKPRELGWVIITPENADEVWKVLQEKKVDLVLIGLTDEGYESLAVTMAEIRNFIAEQRTIIIKYKEYYEPAKEEDKPADSK